MVVIAEGDASWHRVAARLGSDRLSATPGGGERSLSVRRGLTALAGRAAPEDWVLVHDAARPCLEAGDLERLVERVEAHGGGGLLAARAADTLKQAQPLATPGEGPARTAAERAELWRALTPQMFRYGALCAALDAAHATGRYPTDEAQALEWRGERAVAGRGRGD